MSAKATGILHMIVLSLYVLLSYGACAALD